MLSRIKPLYNKFISIDLFQNLTAMANYLGQTMSPDREVRKGAEEFLRSVEGQQGYPILLLTLLNKENVDISIKIAASITFKNFIKRNWKVVSMGGMSKLDSRELIKLDSRKWIKLDHFFPKS